MEGMWELLQHSDPVDYVLASGETHLDRKLVEKPLRGTHDCRTGHASMTGVKNASWGRDYRFANAAEAEERYYAMREQPVMAA